MPSKEALRRNSVEIKMRPLGGAGKEPYCEENSDICGSMRQLDREVIEQTHC